MSFQDNIEIRMKELIDAGEKLKDTNYRPEFVVTQVHHEQADEWAMSVWTILKTALGETSDYYKAVEKLIRKCHNYDEFTVILSYLKSALDNWKGGYFIEAKTLLEAEVFGDLLEQADELQKKGYKDAAAVLGGAVLEAHQRTMCARRAIGQLKANGKPKMINDMNDDLAKAGAYNAHKKKQITAWADLRNNAAHGMHSAYTASDVDAFLRDVRGFCADVS